MIKLVRDLDFLEGTSTMYAAEPWTANSRAILARDPETGELPFEAQQLGLKRVLEVSAARAFLRGWTKSRGREPTLEEKCARLIEFAITDA
jgi:hypothetical protein